MHATTEQLLDIRDGAPADSALVRHIDLCEPCSQQLRQLRLNQAALLDLPALAPSPGVFAQMSERLVNERRESSGSGRGQSLKWAAAAAIVAAVAFWMVPQNMAPQSIGVELTQVAQAVPEEEAVNSGTSLVVAADSAERDELFERSLALEAVAEQLATLGTLQPSSSTDEALSALEAQLALVDYNLSAVQIDQYKPVELNALLTRRVNTLENIVGVQRAELARQGYHGFQVMTASNIEEDLTW